MDESETYDMLWAYGRDNFDIEDSGLFRCKGCGTTFNNQIECCRHLKQLEDDSVQFVKVSDNK